MGVLDWRICFQMSRLGRSNFWRTIVFVTALICFTSLVHIMRDIDNTCIQYNPLVHRVPMTFANRFKPCRLSSNLASDPTPICLNATCKHLEDRWLLTFPTECTRTPKFWGNYSPSIIQHVASYTVSDLSKLLVCVQHAVQEAHPQEPTVNQIMITSYKRSGSTFLGRVLGWNVDSFYWYEPLMSLYENSFIYPDGLVCDYIRPDCMQRQNGTFERELQSMMGYIEDIYNCKLPGHYHWIRRMVKIHSSEMRVGHSWEAFRNCKHFIQSRCLQRLVPVCMRAKYRLIKLLRMDLQVSSQLLRKLPNLKIVHLFRDPRGQLSSHVHTRWYNVHENNRKEVEDDVIVLCDRIRRDLKTTRRLLEEFPDRFRIVQYEDFEDPIYKSRRLYEFLGMEFSVKTTELIKSLIGGSDEAGFHPFSYRDSLNWESIQIVNKHCFDLYHELGYVNFTTETDLRNHNISAVLGLLPYRL